MPDDEELEETQDEEQSGNPDIRALRQAARERDALQKQLAARDRELAFAKAKLDFDDPKLKYFIQGYEGELTPEAIRAKAEEDGFITRSQQQQGRPPVSPQEQQQQQRVMNASSGASETPPEDFRDLISQANSIEEVMALADKHGVPTTWNRTADY